MRNLAFAVALAAAMLLICGCAAQQPVQQQPVQQPSQQPQQNNPPATMPAVPANNTPPSIPPAAEMNATPQQNQTAANQSGASEGETCGGQTGVICQPDLQCITSGQLNAEGTCTNPAKQQLEIQNCPSQRNTACTQEYTPVCGRLVGGSSEVSGYQDYQNPCVSCSTGTNALGYYYGTCAQNNVIG